MEREGLETPKQGVLWLLLSSYDMISSLSTFQFLYSLVNEVSRLVEVAFSLSKLIANRSHTWLILDIRILFATLPPLPEELKKTLFYIPKIIPP